MVKPLRVLLADDERPARRFLGRLLAGFADVEVVAEAANGREALELIEQLKPDLALMDLQMPELGGLDAARLLIHRAAANARDGFPDALESAKAKTFAAEMAQEVTSQALQIHGAAGYGRALPLERMARDARMFAIGGGTVEMMRNVIADRVMPTRALYWSGEPCSVIGESAASFISRP